MAWAICSVKVVIGLKKKLSVWTAWDIRSNDWSYLFKDKFQPSFHPKTISSLATHVKQSVILQVMYVTKFVYKRIIYE